jgi:hypothetical protein
MRPANRIDTLSRMIDLRRLQPRSEANGACDGTKQPKDRESAEGRILEIAEVAYVLQADGFPDPEIFKRIGHVYGTEPPPKERSYDPLRDFIVTDLKTYDPGYLQLGADHFRAVLLVASLWAELYAERLTASSWPPQKMLGEAWAIEGHTSIMRESKPGEEVTWPTFTRSLADLDVLLKEYRYQSATDVRRMKARAIPGDTLHGYSTGAASWSAMMGSSGIALVRDGRSIDHVETLMN